MSVSKQKKFAVVVFNDDNCVSAVPSTWLTNECKSCMWPVKYPQNFKKIIQNPDSEPGTDWIALDVEVKKYYETFEAANSKTTKYLNVDADVSCSEVETPRSSRSRKSKSTHRENKLQEPSTVLFAPLTDDQGSFILETDEQVKTVTRPPLVDDQTLAITDNLVGHAFRSSNVGFSDFNDMFDTNQVNDSISVPTDQVQENVYTVVDDSLKKEIGDLRTELGKFQELTLDRLEVLSQDLKDIRRLVQTISASQTGITPKTAAVFDLFPMQNEDDFHRLENELKDNPTSYQALVNHLKRGGGSSLPDNVYNVLTILITAPFAKEVRLTSKSGKLGFGESKLAECVRDAVHNSLRTDNSGSTDKLINTLIGKWLRQKGFSRNVNTESRKVALDKEKADQEGGGSSTENDKSPEQDIQVMSSSSSKSIPAASE